MHKFFAKPSFLGKKVVFLPECHSTNDELTRIIKNSSELEGALVYTDNQIMGKGQRGNVWLSEPGKNILMSVLLRPKFLIPSDQFYLNLIMGLAIVDTLRKHIKDDIQLKWPNDVLVNGKKISGVLIESILRGNSPEYAIVGIGLNVNQQGFNLLTATSLLLETGDEYDRAKLIELLLCNIEKWYLKLKNHPKEYVLEEYHKLLMWRGERRIFKASKNEFEGKIIGIDKHGRLAINQDGKLKTFGIKEVEFIR